ncbi:aspartate carbamoyltransferase catalytic subunit [Vampirovibrio chlorellavorus]|uniref:aspartate carbamoyltransferase catalytic subunit n=1 Tax=Vampirovibrio chlorellavorus TaxID=758823 RepID=UPI0026EFE171|nr:aspartate carbamoyltransferase catalytic subunit [Vampirovibrio chlorellavorus]
MAIHPPLPGSGSWNRRHVIDSASLTYEEVQEVLRTAASFAHILSRPVKKIPTLRGKVVVNMFYENSTRTRTSFELAAQYLSADAINFSVSSSSVKKGESLIDTAETLAAMGTDAVVIRHASSGVCQQLANYFGDRMCILNAGDGYHDHPTQGLLDLFSLKNRMDDLLGKKIVIVGDILHSRVARSNIHLLKLFGAEVHLLAPSTLLPMNIEALGCKAHTDIEEALRDADVVMCLRMQLERQRAGLIPALREYIRFYSITQERLDRFCKPDVLVMHPGPMNRGVEIASDVADNQQLSLITNQVTSGVAIRMALLYLCMSTPTERSGLERFQSSQFQGSQSNQSLQEGVLAV